MPEKRGPHRAAHIALTQTFVAKGELLLGGAFADPVDGAAIVFLANSAKGNVKGGSEEEGCEELCVRQGGMRHLLPLLLLLLAN